MPAHLDKPTAAHIQKFGARMTKKYGGQKELDESQENLILLQNRNLTTPQGNKPVTQSMSKQSGLPFLIWNENRQLLKIQPAFKIPVPEDMEDLRNHVDSKLEPLLEGLWHRQNRHEPWWEQMTDDYPAIGRAWAFASHVPEEWASEEIKANSEILKSSTDEEELKKARTGNYKLKQNTLPLRTRYVDPRDTWADFGSKIWLPEVIECREIDLETAKLEYGEDAIPEGYKDADGTTTLKVYHYANHMWCATVIGGKDADSSEFVQDPWEHGMRRNPYLLFEADLLPKNTRGWRWCGLLFHAADLIEILDQIITDLAHIHHEWTLAPIIQKLDRDAADDETGDPKTAGRPEKIKYGAGESIAIWNTESIERGVVPEIPQQSIFLMLQVRELIEQTAMVPSAERGEIKAGTSNNAYTSQIQVAQRRARGVLQGMARFVEAWAGNQFAAIYELTKDGDETVSAFGEIGGKKGLIYAGAEDVKGWYDSVVAIIDQPIEIDEYSRWLIGKVKVEDFGFSPEQIIEEMGYPNPEAITRRGRKWKMRYATWDQDVQAVLSLSAQMFATLTPDQAQQKQSLLEGATPQVADIVNRLSGGTSANNGQAQSNTLRANVPQMPQQVPVPTQ